MIDMQTVVCPYCKMENHTSCPEVMAECAYCDKRFAEVRTPYERIVILDRNLDDVWEIAENLIAEWEENGELENEVIVDRRIYREAHEGIERRRYARPMAMH